LELLQLFLPSFKCCGQSGLLVVVSGLLMKCSLPGRPTLTHPPPSLPLHGAPSVAVAKFCIIHLSALFSLVPSERPSTSSFIIADVLPSIDVERTWMWMWKCIGKVGGSLGQGPGSRVRCCAHNWIYRSVAVGTEHVAYCYPWI